MTSGSLKNDPEDYRYWPIEIQVQHVQRRQETIARDMLPSLDQVFLTTPEGAGAQCPGPSALYSLFSRFCAELRQMYHTEHHFIFPYILELARCQRSGSEIGAPPFSSIHKVIPTIEARTGGPRSLMNALLDQGYKTPEFNYAPGPVVQSLESLHQEISRLYFLKHKILYPRAIELENTANRNRFAQKSIYRR